MPYILVGTPSSFRKGDRKTVGTVAALGGWLDRFPWSSFATLTFRKPRWKDALRFVRPLLRHVASAPSAVGAARAFAAEEHHKDGQRLHVHALIFSPGYPDLTDWWDWWFKKFGRCRFSPYERDKGAHYYVAKYVVKEACEQGRYALFQCVNGRPTDTPNRMLWLPYENMKKTQKSRCGTVV